jgi:membrane-bound lytic murein transglycosylase D
VFQENLKTYTKPLSSWTAVQVSKTEMVDQAAKTLGVDVDTLRSVNGIPKGMRIRAGSTVIIPKTARRPGDVSMALADNASLSLDKPPPPPSPKKCKKGTKCPPVKSAKGETKGNSSPKNAASQHKSASTGLAKSAKNGSVNTTSSKGVSKIQ